MQSLTKTENIPVVLGVCFSHDRAMITPVFTNISEVSLAQGVAPLSMTPIAKYSSEYFRPSEAEIVDILHLKAFLEIPGIGPSSLAKLLGKSEGLEALWNASDAFLKTNLSDAKREAFLQRRQKGLDSQWLKVYEDAEIQVIPITSSAYPALLGEIHQPPPLLYVKGALSALTGKTIAVVGTRQMSEYGRQVTEKLVGEMASAGVVVISGLAAGIDTAAHWATLRHQLTTVAVLGNGLDITYPASNKKLSADIVKSAGTLVTEYPLGTQPTKATFPQRNRIVAGLSHGVVVVEGDLKSGAMITARLALEEGRTVFAVPGNILASGSQGTFRLLQHGATPVSQGADILKELQWWIEPAGGVVEASLATTVTNPLESEKMKNGPFSTGGSTNGVSQSRMPALPDGLTDTEKTLLQRIPFDPVSVDALQELVGWPSAQVNATLTLLELDGLIVQLPGANVCRK